LTSDSPPGPLGGGVAAREARRIPTVQELDAGGDRPGHCARRRGGDTVASNIITGNIHSTTTFLSTNLSATGIRLSSVRAMATASRVSHSKAYILKILKANFCFRAPRRDWRDWFIMATVTGGVCYGLYVLAKVCRIVWSAYI
jgi:hypothetical protein